MSTHDDEPGRPDDTAPDGGAAGTPEGDPIAGVRIDEDDADEAVEPDDKAFEVEGPGASAGHA